MTGRPGLSRDAATLPDSELPDSDLSRADLPGVAGRRPGPQSWLLESSQWLCRDVVELVLAPPRQVSPGPQASSGRVGSQSPVEPGTFVDVLCGTSATSLLLRRPLSIGDVDDEGRITLVLRVVGSGTAVLAQLPVGSEVDCLGPLGRHFDLDAVAPGGRALLIGGGVGVPPMHLLARRLHERGVEVRTHLGFRSAEDVFWLDRFRRWGQVALATDDGSAGRRGTVAVLDEEAAELGFVPDAVYACGPTPMLRHVRAHHGPRVRTQLSLEERMACGVGACYACVVELADGSGQLRICHDGPVVEATEVVL